VFFSFLFFLRLLEWLVSYSLVWIEVTRSRNADYDGLKKYLTTLRKNVFSYVDIEATGVAAWQAAATIFLSLDEGN
jgi:hypothetical protein